MSHAWSGGGVGTGTNTDPTAGAPGLVSDVNPLDHKLDVVERPELHVRSLLGVILAKVGGLCGGLERGNECDLKPHIGYNIGVQAPISTRPG